MNMNAGSSKDLKRKPNLVLYSDSSKRPNMCQKENGKHQHSNKHSERLSLPIFQARGRIIQEVRRHNSLIIIGETGSGKTTQIPQFLYEESLNSNKMIAITQPRRVAATTISNRVAEEMHTELGDLVGYTIRFEDMTSPTTKLKYMTDGMLLRETILDDCLSLYSFVILDEAHERTIHTDVLLGVVKKAQRLRKEMHLTPLKIIIMSATVDVDQFSSYFGNIPVLYLEGRQHNIQIYHAIQPQEDYIFSCLVTVFQIHSEAPANQDILVFLTGQEEIESMVQAIKTIAKSEKISLPLKVIPLYSSLPMNQQMDAFRQTPDGMRKVIVSTNIAETSVTVRGVKYVVDSGMVKVRVYNPQSGLDVLKVQRISQAQCWQRTGRAGRESDGFCYRVFTKQQYEKMPENIVPEILRCNLAGVCLQLLAMEIDVLNFDFMDKPPEEALETALEELKLLGAIDTSQPPKLTELGEKMSKFPIHPRYSKILISSVDFGCVEEILSIIAVLSGESIFLNPSAKRQEAKEAHKKFVSSEGDHITLLQIYRNFKKINHPKQWCHENFLNVRNLQYASKIRTQLAEICKRCKILLISCGQEFVKVRKCLVAGLFMNIAELHEDKKYMMLATKKQVSIHPSSVLFGTLPHCILFSEVIHTTKCYVRDISIIDADHLLELMPEYFRKHRLSGTQVR